jgi:hypothetical protein
MLNLFTASVRVARVSIFLRIYSEFISEAIPAIIPIFFVLSPRAHSRGFSKNKKGFSLLSGLWHSVVIDLIRFHRIQFYLQIIDDKILTIRCVFPHIE